MPILVETSVEGTKKMFLSGLAYFSSSTMTAEAPFSMALSAVVAALKRSPENAKNTSPFLFFCYLYLVFLRESKWNKNFRCSFEIHNLSPKNNSKF